MTCISFIWVLGSPYVQIGLPPHRCFTVWVGSIHCSLRVMCVQAGSQSLVLFLHSHVIWSKWAELGSIDWLSACVLCMYMYIHIHVHVHVCGMYMCILCGELANSTLSSGHVKFSMSVHGLWLKWLADIIHVYCAWSVLVCMCVPVCVYGCLLVVA